MMQPKLKEILEWYAAYLDAAYLDADYLEKEGYQSVQVETSILQALKEAVDLIREDAAENHFDDCGHSNQSIAWLRRWMGEE